MDPGMAQGPAGMDLGQPVMEPEINASTTQANTKAVEMPKGGEI